MAESFGKDLDNLVARQLFAPLPRREFLRRAMILGLSLTTAGAVLEACGGGTAAAVNLKKTLVYAQAWTPLTFDPARMNGSELVYGTQFYQALVRYVPSKGGIIGQLATKWSVSSDATELTFNLNPNAKFSTGNPVTANDVKFSLERLWNIQSPLSNVVKGYQTIDAVDAHTVKITLQAPDASYLVKLSGPQCGIFDSQVAMQNGAVSDSSAPTADKALDFFNKQSIGSGPFMFASYVPNTSVTIMRNPKYWGATPALDKVIIQNVPDAASQRQLLERGDIDIAAGLDFATAKDMTSDSGITIQYAKGTTNVTILFMTDSPNLSAALSNNLVRQAVVQSIDYDGLKLLANGHADIPATSIPVGLAGCCGVQPMTQNLAQAKQLLAQGGYPNGFDVTFAYGAVIGYGVDQTLIATKLQSDLARVGIKLNLKPYGPGPSFLNDYRAAILSMGISGIGGVCDPDAFVGDIWVSSHNFVTHRLHFADPAIDSLYPQSLSTTGSARQAVYDQLQKIFQQDAAVKALLQPDAILASSSKVHGYIFLPETIGTDFSLISVEA